MQLEGATAVITGAGSGIGRAVALTLAEKGTMSLLVGRRRDPLEETARQAGLPADAIVTADVATSAGRAAVCAAASRFKRLDLLINNAGAVGVGLLGEQTDENVASMVAVNLTAPACLARGMLPLLSAAAREAWGARIVNIGSMFGDIAFPYFAVYSATKFGLRGLSDALRRELAPRGIGVTYVAPRATSTPAAETFAHLVQPFGMRLDPPERVARQIVRGIERDADTVYPRGVERLFVAVQRLLPGRIDAAVGRKFSAFDAARQTESQTDDLSLADQTCNGKGASA